MRPILGCCILVLGLTRLAAAEEPTTVATNSPAGRAEQRATDAWNKLSPREKQQVLKLHRGLQAMPPAERAKIRERIDHFQQMSPAERDQLRQNHERWQKMTPEQRDRARQLFRERRRQYEVKWRQEHPGQEPPPYGFKPPPAPQPAGSEEPTAESVTKPPNEERKQE